MSVKNPPADPDLKFAHEAENAFADAAHRIEAVVQEGLEQLRAQTRVYADVATQQIEEASEFLTEQVRARPLATAGLALGVGLLVGVLLSNAARRH